MRRRAAAAVRVPVVRPARAVAGRQAAVMPARRPAAAAVPVRRAAGSELAAVLRRAVAHPQEAGRAPAIAWQQVERQPAGCQLAAARSSQAAGPEAEAVLPAAEPALPVAAGSAAVVLQEAAPAWAVALRVARLPWRRARAEEAARREPALAAEPASDAVPAAGGPAALRPEAGLDLRPAGEHPAHVVEAVREQVHPGAAAAGRGDVRRAPSFDAGPALRVQLHPPVALPARR